MLKKVKYTQKTFNTLNNFIAIMSYTRYYMNLNYYLMLMGPNQTLAGSKLIFIDDVK